MRVVVTGGAGYLGSRLCAHLLDAGMEVVVLDKLLFGEGGLAGLNGNSRFRLIPGDIRDKQIIQEALRGADGVVHLAALVGERACSWDPQMTRRINEEGTRSLLEGSRAHGIRRWFFISTCSNYGVVDSNSFADEQTPLSPQSLYAESKIRGEEIVLSTAQGGMASCVLRLATLCGVSTRMRFDLLVNEMARDAVLGKTISIFCPEAWRPFLHLEDAVRAIRCCLTAPENLFRGQIYNVVGENYQKFQLLELARRNFPELSVEIQKATPDPRNYRVCADRIAQALKFRPERKIENAFLDVAEAVRQDRFKDSYHASYTSSLSMEQIHTQLG